MSHSVMNVITRTRLAVIGFATLAAVTLVEPVTASQQSFSLDRTSQESLSLTIYNNFAVIREVRKVVLPKGPVELEYLDVARTIEPASVNVRSIGHEKDFRVLEQSYEYDLLNRESLLDTYIGRKLKYSRSVLQGTTYEKVFREGILLSTNPEIVEFGDEIEISPEGVISLPNLPDALNLRPTLIWNLENDRRGQQRLETSYLADGISWQADYQLVLDESAQTFDMQSWVTVNNTSGNRFENAALKLIAGNVNRVMNRPKSSPVYASREQVASSFMQDNSISVASVFDYQQYALPNRTTLQNNEEKQIRFVSASDVSYVKRYSITSGIQPHQYLNVEEPQVQVSLGFDNSKANNLGRPMAGGKVRAFTADKDGVLQMIGESQLAHKAVDEEIEIALGTAFDVKASRKQVEFRRFDNRQGERRSFEATYEVHLTNARDKPVDVIVNEIMQGEWEIIEQSIVGEKESSSLQKFVVPVPASGEATLRYKVGWKI